MGERDAGSVEARGSSPLTSTLLTNATCLSGSTFPALAPGAAFRRPIGRGRRTDPVAFERLFPYRGQVFLRRGEVGEWGG